MKLEKVCVYCASSRQANPVYRQAAKRLGEILAKNSITIAYGGGAVGSMGALAEGAISFGGKVVGIIPRFMVDLEWANSKISDLIIVNDMAERKKKMIEGQFVINLWIKNITICGHLLMSRKMFYRRFPPLQTGMKMPGILRRYDFLV